MENVDQQSVEQDVSATALRARLGELLSRERLSQQKDVNDVARRLMLSKLQLLAIETGASESFHHERRYIQGIKSYVFYLGLQSRADVNELVTQVEGWSAEALKASPAARVAQLHRLAETPAASKSYVSRRPRYIYVGIIGLVIFGAIALAISEGWPFKNDEQEVASANNVQSLTTTVVTPLSSPTVRPGASTVASGSVSGSVSGNVSDTVVAQGKTEAPTVAPTPAYSATPTAIATPSTASVSAPDSTQVSSSVALPAQVAMPAPAQANLPDAAESASVAERSAAAARDEKNLMRIDFNAECWVSLQTADGKKEDRIYKSGESISVPIADVTGLVLGNAPAAKVFLAGRQVDVMSKGLTYGNVTRLDQKGIQLLLKN